MATNVEWIQVITAFIGMCFTIYAVRRALLDFRITAQDGHIELRPIAIRRLRHQSMLLLVQTTLFLVGIISLRLPVGVVQAVVRSYSMTIVSVTLLVLSLIDHWDPLTSWLLQWNPRRRATDQPQTPIQLQNRRRDDRQDSRDERQESRDERQDLREERQDLRDERHGS